MVTWTRIAIAVLLCVVVFVTAFMATTLVESIWYIPPAYGEETTLPFRTWSEVSNGVYPPSIAVYQCLGGMVFMAQSKAPNGVWYNIGAGETRWFMVRAPEDEHDKPGPEGYQGFVDESGRLALTKVWSDYHKMFEHYGDDGCPWLVPKGESI